MIVIDDKISEELQTVLDGFTDWFFEQDRSKIVLKNQPDENEYYTSEEYHDSIYWDMHIGFPEPHASYGNDLAGAHTTPESWRPTVLKLNKDLNNLLCSKFNAVMMYYPAGGYIGWHDNRNVPGYNILLSYTKNGKGWFKFKENGETVTLHDKPGWNVKAGYYGSSVQKAFQVRHCARAYEERLTFGFVIPDEYMWEMMLEDILVPHVNC